ncbi:MAG: BtrH N-terminal domain-containing protein, partial [Chloroflexota bacterium]
MTLEGLSHSGFRHPEAGPLSAALGWGESPSGPYTEAMLFGIGGGISFAYFASDYGETRTLYLGAQAMTARKGMMEAMRDAAGASGRPSAASSARAARTRIRKSLDNGVPVIAWVDPSALPYHDLAEPPAQYYTVLVHGLDEDSGTVALADLPSGLAQVSLEDFEAAHNPAYPPTRQTLIVERPSPPPNLTSAAHAGIHACCAQMLHGWGGPQGTARNLGVAGMAQWAALMTDPTSERGWLRFFPTPAHRFRSLAAIHDQIQCAGRGGGALRPLYADFIQQATELLSNRE